MREDKYRYVLRNKTTGKIEYKWYTLKQVEYKGLSHLFDIDNYEIVSRDRYTGIKDRDGKEIYEGDVIKYNNKIYWIGFSEGCFDCRVKLTDTNGDELFLFDHRCIEIIGNSAKTLIHWRRNDKERNP